MIGGAGGIEGISQHLWLQLASLQRLQHTHVFSFAMAQELVAIASTTDTNRLRLRVTHALQSHERTCFCILLDISTFRVSCVCAWDRNNTHHDDGQAGIYEAAPSSRVPQDL